MRAISSGSKAAEKNPMTPMKPIIPTDFEHLELDLGAVPVEEMTINPMTVLDSPVV